MRPLMEQCFQADETELVPIGPAPLYYAFHHHLPYTKGLAQECWLQVAPLPLTFGRPPTHSPIKGPLSMKHVGLFQILPSCFTISFSNDLHIGIADVRLKKATWGKRIGKPTTKPGGNDMAAKELALHEQLEVHEVLIFKTTCVTKSKMFVDLVQDKKLKEIIEEDLALSEKAIKDLKKVLADASK